MATNPPEMPEAFDTRLASPSMMIDLADLPQAPSAPTHVVPPIPTPTTTAPPAIPTSTPGRSLPPIPGGGGGGAPPPMPTSSTTSTGSPPIRPMPAIPPIPTSTIPPIPTQQPASSPPPIPTAVSSSPPLKPTSTTSSPSNPPPVPLSPRPVPPIPSSKSPPPVHQPDSSDEDDEPPPPIPAPNAAATNSSAAAVSDSTSGSTTTTIAPKPGFSPPPSLKIPTPPNSNTPPIPVPNTTDASSTAAATSTTTAESSASTSSNGTTTAGATSSTDDPSSTTASSVASPTAASAASSSSPPPIPAASSSNTLAVPATPVPVRRGSVWSTLLQRSYNPPFLSPSVSIVHMSGSLKKFGSKLTLSSLNARYFVLSHHSLQYYKSDPFKSPQGSFSLIGAVLKEESESVALGLKPAPSPGTVWSISTKPTITTIARKYVLVCNTAEERRVWMELLSPSTGDQSRKELLPQPLGQWEQDGNLCIEGWLLKCGGEARSPSWTKRYFMFHRSTHNMSYFKSPNKAAGFVPIEQGASVDIPGGAAAAAAAAAASVAAGGAPDTTKPALASSSAAALASLPPGVDTGSILSYTQSADRCYVLLAAKKDERDEWTQALRCAIEFRAGVIPSFRTKAAIAASSPPMSRQHSLINTTPGASLMVSPLMRPMPPLPTSPGAGSAPPPIPGGGGSETNTAAGGSPSATNNPTTTPASPNASSNTLPPPIPSSTSPLTKSTSVIQTSSGTVGVVPPAGSQSQSMSLPTPSSSNNSTPNKAVPPLPLSPTHKQVGASPINVANTNGSTGSTPASPPLVLRASATQAQQQAQQQQVPQSPLMSPSLSATNADNDPDEWNLGPGRAKGESVSYVKLKAMHSKHGGPSHGYGMKKAQLVTTPPPQPVLIQSASDPPSENASGTTTPNLSINTTATTNSAVECPPTPSSTSIVATPSNAASSSTDEPRPLSIQEEVLALPRTSNLTQVERSILELYSTEMTYVSGLRIICTQYLLRFRKHLEHRYEPRWFEDTEYAQFTLFQNVETIRDVNMRLLDELESISKDVPLLQQAIQATVAAAALVAATNGGLTSSGSPSNNTSSMMIHAINNGGTPSVTPSPSISSNAASTNTQPLTPSSSVSSVTRLPPQILLSSLGRIARTFRSFIPFFKIYTLFAQSYDEELKMLESITDRRSGLKTFIALTDICENITFGSLMITPIQRVGRYVLLLETIYKHTPIEFEGNSDIEGALVEMKKVGILINETVALWEAKSKVVELQAKIDLPILAPGRFLVREGVLKKLYRLTSNTGFLKTHLGKKVDTFVFFLMNDALLQCKKRQMGMSDKLVCKAILPLNGMVLEDLADTTFEKNCWNITFLTPPTNSNGSASTPTMPRPGSLSNVIQDNPLTHKRQASINTSVTPDVPKTITVYAASHTEKYLWLADIMSLIEHQKTTQKTLKRGDTRMNV